MQLVLVGFIIYFMIIGLISTIAYATSKKGRNYSQAVLGDRSINYVLTALSAHASDMSDWLFMAFPAAIYMGGLVNAWIAIGLVSGMWFTWKFIAPGLRNATEKYQSMTLSTYFERRYHDTSGIIRMTSALMSILFFSIYIAAGLKGFGFLAESVFDLPYIAGVVVALICIMFYIFLGGYRTLAWIDCFQALFLLVVIFIVPYIGFFQVGGFDAIASQAAQKNISLNLWPDTWTGCFNTILMSLSWAVGYSGTPHIVTKFMGISDVKEISKAQYIGLAWQVSVLLAATMVGLIGIAYFPITLNNPELVFVEIVKNLFSPLQIGFILSAISGATLSVVTAQVLVLVSVITEDFYRGTVRKNASEKELLWVYNASLLLIAALSFLVSLNKTSSIQQLVHYAWMGFGASFGPLMILSLHSSYINKYGAMSSIIVGGCIASVWHQLGRPIFLTSYGLDVPAVIPGFIFSIIFAYAVSYVTKKMVFNDACESN